MRVGCKRAIVYLDFVKDVPPLAIALREKGVKSCSYHGKSMSGHDKAKALENWKAGDIQVTVSTSAFGLGIDDRDIGVIIRAGCPPTPEEMVQMFGRAGQDGQEAEGNYTHVAHSYHSFISLLDCTPPITFYLHFLCSLLTILRR